MKSIKLTVRVPMAVKVALDRLSKEKEHTIQTLVNRALSAYIKRFGGGA